MANLLYSFPQGICYCGKNDDYYGLLDGTCTELTQELEQSGYNRQQRNNEDYLLICASNGYGLFGNDGCIKCSDEHRISPTLGSCSIPASS